MIAGIRFRGDNRAVGFGESNHRVCSAPKNCRRLKLSAAAVKPSDTMKPRREMRNDCALMTYALKNASKSALMTWACVVIMP
jgi:hypothetical protein